MEIGNFFVCIHDLYIVDVCFKIGDRVEIIEWSALLVDSDGAFSGRYTCHRHRENQDFLKCTLPVYTLRNKDYFKLDKERERKQADEEL